MKLIDILEKVNEANEVKVFSALTSQLLSTYDGRDAIDKECNDYNVKFINVMENILEVYVDSPYEYANEWL